MLKRFGLITAVDATAIAHSLLAVAKQFAGTTLNLCEIGICHGETSRGMAEFLTDRGIAFDYVGVDNGRDGAGGAVCADVPPFAGARVVQGESSHVYIEVSNGLHFLFVDGGHDINHVMLDALHYGDKVLPGGRMILHDASPLAQNKCDWQGTGPKHHPDFGTATLEAIRKLGMLPMLRPDWRIVEHTYDPALDYGGVIVFERVAI